ncbi:MAG: MBL fold metallo-hydrolase [Thermomonas sp.]|uniref:MBL fold metallo-hydrolase n=1 Tax=Thermomonas sp. TaxID=1971895 RepID=UPI0039E3831C
MGKDKRVLTATRARRRSWRRVLVLFLLGAIALTVATTQHAPVGDYTASQQNADGRFRNPVQPQAGELPDSTLRVWWNFLFNKPDNTEPHAPVPVRRLTRAELDAAPDRSLYRLGHSTILMKLRGQWWLTDPVFSERASPVQWFGPKRFHAPPIALDELPPIRAVLLSHDHYDHLDHAAIKALAGKVDLFLTPLGVGDRMTDWGVPREKVQQFDWWQNIGIDGVRFTMTPAQHFSGRGLRDGNRTLWGSWAINDGDKRVFFSGDSGYFAGFAEIGSRLGPFDLTLMETGAYNVQWPYVHMQPAQTVQAHIDLGGRWLLPIHNGTFDLAMHAWFDPFEQVLRFAGEKGVDVATPVMGERIDLNAPHAGERWWRSVMAAEAAR